MPGMQAGLSRAQHPAVFRTTWLVSTVVGCTVAFVAVALMPRTLAPLEWAESAALVTMAILVVIVELRPIMMSRYEGDPVSIAPAFVFATLYLWGWEPAVTLMAVSVLLSEALARKDPWKLFFNVGNYTLSVVAASVVLSREWPETDANLVTAADLGLVVLSWVVYHLVNLAQVAGLAEDQTWWDSFTEDFWFYTVSTGWLAAVCTLRATSASSWAELQWSSTMKNSSPP
jgi:hypothetical protein